MRVWWSIINNLISKSVLLLAALFFLACGKGEEQYIPGVSEEGAFEFSASIQNNSRVVVDSEFRNGDVIGVFAVKRTNPEVAEVITQEKLAAAYAVNVAYEFDATTMNFKPVGGGIGISIPRDGAALDFYAYYPYDATLGQPGNDDFLAIPMTIAQNQSEESAFNRSDLIYGTGTAKLGRKAVHLNFRHLLCYIRLTLQADGVEEDNIKEVYLNKKYNKIKFDISTGTVSLDPSQTPDERLNVRFHREETVLDQFVYGAIIAPQSISSAEEDFEILIEFSGVTQGYTSRMAAYIDQIVGGESYHPTVVMTTPPARVRINVEQLVAETNYLNPQTWNYVIKNEGRKMGEVCREYIRSTPYTDEDGTHGVSMDAQMIVAYPMAANGKNIDMTRGVVLAVLKDDALGDPLGEIDMSQPVGGTVRFYSDTNGEERAVYVPGSHVGLSNEFYIYNRTIYFETPLEEGTSTPVAPIVRTRLLQDYLYLASGEKYGIVKIGTTHITKQELVATKYIDGKELLYVPFSDWKSVAETNEDKPIYTIYNGTYLYNFATVNHISTIAAEGWSVPVFQDNIFISYLEGSANIGKYLRLQTGGLPITVSGESKVTAKGNNKAGLSMTNNGVLNGEGYMIDATSSVMWTQTGEIYNRAYSISYDNQLEDKKSPGVKDGISIRLVRDKN